MLLLSFVSLTITCEQTINQLYDASKDKLLRLRILIVGSRPERTRRL